MVSRQPHFKEFPSDLSSLKLNPGIGSVISCHPGIGPHTCTCPQLQVMITENGLSPRILGPAWVRLTHWWTWTTVLMLIRSENFIFFLVLLYFLILPNSVWLIILEINSRGNMTWENSAVVVHRNCTGEGLGLILGTTCRQS